MAYAARRHLGMSWDEWKGLPWYEQRALREGLLEEFANTKVIDATGTDDALRDAGIQLG